MFRGVILLNIHINQDVGLDVFFLMKLYDLLLFMQSFRLNAQESDDCWVRNLL